VDGSAVNAVVVLETAGRAVRAIVVSAEERRLHHGTFLAPVTREKQDGRFKTGAAAVHELLEGPVRTTIHKGRSLHVENIEMIDADGAPRRAACEFC